MIAIPSRSNASAHRQLTAVASLLLLSAAVATAEIKTVVAHDPDGVPGFRLPNVPPTARSDAATTAKFTLLDGEADSNGGSLAQLHDGKLPTGADDPGQNFFFAAGTTGGRILVDLNRVVEIKQVNTYSWHPSDRGPQVYDLYASDGTSASFAEKPAQGAASEGSGWKLIAKVDTRPQGGGQHVVSVSDSDGLIGKYRYLLFDISSTESDDSFGNTFYSEIDVIEEGAPTESAVAAAAGPFVIKSTDGYCEISIDSAGAPELQEWAEQKLAPVLAEWYPKLVAMMPSDGYEAPKHFSVVIKPGNGVAATGGTRITANSTWLARELNGEAIGALVHEEIHVIQQYGGRRRSAGGKRPPGWLVEGIPDYLRWFKYEPQSHGADLIWLQGRRNQKRNYDGMYRISANFLDYVVEHYDKNNDLIAKVNAACRQGKYDDDLWSELTGKPLAELNDEWKAAVQKQLETKAESGLNTLTEAERAAGWKLLFNGVDLAGWHNFKREGVRPGWQVKDGALVCVDPHNAGDIVTTDQFGAFELELDYNISEGGNSGIIFHVTDQGGAVWATGPEFQLEDNAKAADPQRCGWLYALYQPADDPKTGKPLDATKPAGEWNHVRLVISPEKCEHFINGVKYFEYVIGSEDFNARVAKSKFGKMPLFAKSNSGYLALQGDHGQVSFRNIKVRSLDK
jgi:hypothetical protein